MSIKITDNSEEVKAAMQAATIRALVKCGLAAERYAKKLCHKAKLFCIYYSKKGTHIVPTPPKGRLKNG